MTKVFETPSFVWFILILGGLSVNAHSGPLSPFVIYTWLKRTHLFLSHVVTAFVNDSWIFHWPLIGPFLLYLNTNYGWLLQLIFVAAIVAHLLEGYYAYHLALLLNLSTGDVIKWTLQTLLLGYPSLCIIQRKCNEENKHK